MNLKQLSEHLGLSQTTVSRALNGYPEVNETTRKRVELAAAEGNYRPNLRAMSLATGRAMAIGHVIGYELMLTIAESKDEESIYRNLAAKRAVDGVIVHSPMRNDPRLALLNEIGLPFVVHGRVCDSTSDYNWIDMNNRQAFKQATQLLIDLGHRKIALINGQEHLSFAWLRKLGFLDALNENNISENPDWQTASELTETYGYQTATKMLASDNTPSAFLVSSYIVALGIRRAISQAGLVIGKDISVIIHDDELSYFHNGGAFPQFTSTRSSVREAGMLAADMLLKQIDDPNLYPQSVLLESHLTVGSSTGSLRQIS